MSDVFYFFATLGGVTALLLLVDYLRGRREPDENTYLDMRRRQNDSDELARHYTEIPQKRGPTGFEAQGERRRQQLQNAAKSGSGKGH